MNIHYEKICLSSRISSFSNVHSRDAARSVSGLTNNGTTPFLERNRAGCKSGLLAQKLVRLAGTYLAGKLADNHCFYPCLLFALALVQKAWLDNSNAAVLRLYPAQSPLWAPGPSAYVASGSGSSYSILSINSIPADKSASLPEAA